MVQEQMDIQSIGKKKKKEKKKENLDPNFTFFF